MTSRRTFITRILNALGIITVAPIVYAVSSLIYPPLVGRKKRAATYLLDDPSSVFQQSDFAIVKVGDKDVIVFQKNDKTYEAISLQCTHAGCSLLWKNTEQQFYCSCHGGAFHRDGTVAAPPPTRPLEHLSVRSDNGVITIIDKPMNE